MNKTITIKNLTIGEGNPKICIPLVAKNTHEINLKLDLIGKEDFDILEWRIDYFDKILKLDEIQKATSIIKNKLNNKPLLLTIRTKFEGGNININSSVYFELVNLIITNKLVDIIDIELSQSKDMVIKSIKLAKDNNIKVMLSHHNFNETPSSNTIISTLKTMQELNADLCKVAYMPNREQDVLTVLNATRTMYEQYASTPIITISLGNLGRISRVCGKLTGSAITYAFVDEACAPGQIHAKKMKEILNLL